MFVFNKFRDTEFNKANYPYLTGWHNPGKLEINQNKKFWNNENAIKNTSDEHLIHLNKELK